MLMHQIDHETYNALVAAAKRHGYESITEFALALEGGELATVLMDQDDRWLLLGELASHAATLNAGTGPLDAGVASILNALIKQLRAAAE